MTACRRGTAGGGERIEARVAALVRRLTGRDLDPADLQRSFVDWGADSLMLIQLARAIDVEFGVRVPFRGFFGSLGSLAALTDHLVAASAAAGDADAAPATAAAEPATAAEPTPPQAAAAQAADLDGRASPSVQQIVTRQLAIMQEQLTLLRDDVRRPKAVPAEGATPSREGAADRRETEPERPYIPFSPPDLSTAPLEAGQREYLEGMRQRLGRRSGGSRELAARQRQVLADPRLMTGFRPMWKDLVYPLYVESAHGSRLRDVDGHEYIDLCMGYGSYLLGHAPPFWIEALQRGSPVPIGPQNRLVGRVAELVTTLTSADRAAFFNSGTEAVMAAIRAARTITGRDRIVMFAGSYHGWSDQVLAQQRPGAGPASPSAPGVPASVLQEARVLTYGSEEALSILRREAASAAAVLVEPVQSRRPDLKPIEFLRQLREITEAAGIALIFDEMITGFRVAPGGVQQLWGIPADLAIYGKAAAGGLPIGIVAGRCRWMSAFDGGVWNYGDDSGPDTAVTFCSGTYFKHPLVMSGAEACLSHLQRSGPALQRGLNERVARWVEGLAARLEAHGLPVAVPTFGSLFRLRWTQPFPYAQLLYYALQERGVFAWEGGNFFVSTAHTDEDLAIAATAIEESLLELRTAGFLRAGGGPADERGTAAAVPSAAVPLTPAQRDVWLSIQVGHAPSEAYNECIALEFVGELDVDALTRSLTTLAARHDALRVVFDGDTGAQTFTAPACYTLTRADVSGALEAGRRAHVDAWLRGFIATPFDLQRGPLLRAGLASLGDDRHVFALVVHHLVVDNLSIGILMRELPILYASHRTGALARLPQAGSFAAFGRAESEPDRLIRAEAFWLERLRGVPCPPAQLPAETCGADTDDAVTGTAVIGPAVFERLAAIAVERETTIVAAVLAAFSAFLHRATGRDDLVIGMPVAGQPFAGPEPLVGYCLNVLPLRSRLDPHESFGAAVGRIGSELAEALEHRTCSLSTLVERLAIPDRGHDHPLIACLWNYDVAGSPPSWAGLTVLPLTSPKTRAKLPLEMNVSQENRALRLELVGRSRVLTAAAISRWLDAFVRFVEWTSAAPSAAVGAAPLLGPAAETQLKAWGTGPVVERRRETLPGIVADAAAAAPGRVAVIMGSEQLTYGALRARVRRFGAYAQSLGVGPDVLVPICLERSIDLVVAVLGVLEAGGAYVPIDPTLVTDRIKWVTEDSRASVVFVDAATAPLVEPHLPPGSRLEHVGGASGHTGEPAPVNVHPEHLAYVIYTSGSTGRPKGAMNTHAGVVNQLRWIQEALPLGPYDRVLQKTTLSFDASVWELFWPLSAGATLVLASRDAQFDPAALAEDIEAHAVTTAIFVPSMLRQVTALARPVGRTLARIGCIGEAVTPALAADVRRRMPHAEFWNFYGPTEVAVAVTAHRCDERSDRRRVPIGVPIANSRVYITDTHGDLVPIGAEGELCLGGMGVGRGYWNRPDLTADRFVPDPHGPPGSRAYRTGDRVRFGADGRLEFIGRLDGQLKLRGYRIEVGEIEAVMTQHAGVAEAAVWLTGPVDDPALAGAWTGGATEPELRAWLTAKLPRYMIPARLSPVPSLPRLPNGKLDRPALPGLAAGFPTDERPVETLDPMEDVVRGVWQDVLGRPVSRRDSFVSVGGHSLHAMQVINRLAVTFGVTLPVRTLFEDASLATFSARIAESVRGTDIPALAPGPREGLPRASVAQERFWFLDQLYAGTSACNIPLSMRITGRLDVDALRRALDAVVARHEVLRTTFEVTAEGLVCQRIVASLPPEWEVREGDEAGAVAWARSEASRPFDLSRGPLLRSVLVSVAPDRWIWLLVVHHIASDAWSIQILWRELAELYDAATTGRTGELPALPLQYADYALWHRTRLTSGALDASLAYWRHQLANSPPPLAWHRGTPTPGSAESDVSIRLHVDPETVALLRRLMGATAATPSMFIVAAMQIVAWSHTSQADFLVGVPIHGRTRRALEPLIGCFVNMLPIRAALQGAVSFADLLADVRSRMLDAYAHADVPFELALSDPDRGSRSPVGLVVSTRNVPVSSTPIAALRCEPFEAARPAIAHELLCEVAATPRGWSIDLTGSTEFFTPSTIARLGEHLVHVLGEVAAEPARTVASLSTLSQTSS